MNDSELDQALGLVRNCGEKFDPIGGLVLARIRRERRVRWSAWTAIAAAAVVCWGALLVPVLMPLEQRLTIQVAAIPGPSLLPPVKVVGRKPGRKPVVRQDPVEVRLETADPDVLIIWLVDGEQGEGNQ